MRDVTSSMNICQVPARVVSVALLWALAGCVSTGAEPLADRGPDGLPADDRLWVERPERASAPAETAADDAPVADARYTVRAGDSLGAIARRFTGDADRWRDIAGANGIDDPAGIAVGTELTVPAALLGDAASGTRPAGDGGDRVGLIDALGLAQAYDATFRIAREQYDVARAAVPLARSGLLPQAGLQAEYGRFFDLGDDDGGDAATTGVGVGGEGTDAGAGVGVGVLPLANEDYDEAQLSATLSQAPASRTVPPSTRSSPTSSVAGPRPDPPTPPPAAEPRRVSLPGRHRADRLAPRSRAPDAPRPTCPPRTGAAPIAPQTHRARRQGRAPPGAPPRPADAPPTVDRLALALSPSRSIRACPTRVPARSARSPRPYRSMPSGHLRLSFLYLRAPGRDPPSRTCPATAHPVRPARSRPRGRCPGRCTSPGRAPAAPHRPSTARRSR